MNLKAMRISQMTNPIVALIKSLIVQTFHSIRTAVRAISFVISPAGSPGSRCADRQRIVERPKPEAEPRADFFGCRHEHDGHAQQDAEELDNCLACSDVELIAGKNDLTVLRPDLAVGWYSERNGGFQPSEVFPDFSQQVWWLGECGYEWRIPIAEHVLSREGALCPILREKRLLRASTTSHPSVLSWPLFVTLRRI